MADKGKEADDLVFLPEQVRDLSFRHLDKIKEGGYASGVRSGLVSLDKIMNPLNPGQLMVVLARPSHGKSALMMSIARNAAIEWAAREKKEKMMPIIVSAEMSVEEIALREISHAIPYDSAKLYRGELDDWSQAYDAVEQIYNECPILYIGHSGYSSARRPRLSMENIRHAIDRVCEKYGMPPELIGYDYAQRFKISRTTRDRRDEVSEIVEGIKDDAIYFQAPVILGSQAGRGVDQKNPPVPDMDDAKETGNLEETADVILSLMRPSRYYKIGEVIPKTNNLICSTNLFYIRLLKQRMGDAGGGLWAHFDMSITKLADLEMERIDMNTGERTRINPGM